MRTEGEEWAVAIARAVAGLITGDFGESSSHPSSGPNGEEIHTSKDGSHYYLDDEGYTVSLKD